MTEEERRFARAWWWMRFGRKARLLMFFLYFPVVIMASLIMPVGLAFAFFIIFSFILSFVGLNCPACGNIFTQRSFPFPRFRWRSCAHCGIEMGSPPPKTPNDDWAERLAESSHAWRKH